MTQKYDPSNIFAKIIRGEIPAHKVYEDPKILAFHDISKAAPLHILVVPKGEYICFSHFTANAPQQDIIDFFKKIGQIAQELGLEEAGYRLITNEGENASQTVPHFHIHILGGKKLNAKLN
jgi:hypothetical protein